MASFARKFGSFALTVWPIILFYALAAVIVVFGAVYHPLQHPKAAPGLVPQSLQPPDTVPNNISCQFRGEGFCQPKEFTV